MNKNSIQRILVAVLLITIVFGLAVSGDTLVVDEKDPGCNDQFGDPYCTLAAAMADADDDVNVDKIIVHDGTYDNEIGDISSREDFTFSGRDYPNVYERVNIYGCENVIIEGLYFSTGSDGIKTTGNDNTLIQDNILEGNPRTGIVNLLDFPEDLDRTVTVRGNDILENYLGIHQRHPNALLDRNLIENNVIGIVPEPYTDYSIRAQFNSITDNEIGITPWFRLSSPDPETFTDLEPITAALNWWGSRNGPAYYSGYSFEEAEDVWFGNYEPIMDDGPSYDGGGDVLIGPAYFSPWLGADPDADPDTPGIQFIDPLPIIVASVGPEPTTENGNTGYLDMAIWGAGYIPVVGQVIVQHGTWNVEEPIGNNVELISEKGSTCHTCLEDVEGSEITIDDNDVTIGKLKDFSPRGFIVEDEVVVKSGVDSSTVHLNWNDIRNTVENNGEGRLDAEYNWWGDLDPSDDTEGKVDYHPYLPEEVCSFVDYMEKHEIEDPQAAIAGRSIEDEGGETQLISHLIANFNVKPRVGEELIDEFGYPRVREAFENTDGDYEAFLNNLGVSSL